MGRVFEFAARVLREAWRWGVAKAGAVANWARQNWRIVLRWLERGLSFYAIVEAILRALGLA